jgi:hypothetical protein
VRAQLELLTRDLNAVITARNARVSDTTLTAAELQTIDRGFEQQAADRVRSHDQQIKKIVESYDQLLASRIGHLQEFGYTAAPAHEGAADGGFEGSEAVGGVVDSFTETGEMLVALNPLRALTEPAEYRDTLFRYAGGIAAVPGHRPPRPGQPRRPTHMGPRSSDDDLAQWL